MRSKSFKVTANGQVQTGETLVTGFSFSGFTNVSLYDGTSTSGTQIVNCPTPGAYYVNNELHAPNGLFAAVTGTGTLIVNVA